LDDCGRTERGQDEQRIFGRGYKRWAYDGEREERLWRDSLGMAGLEENV
jgi:hypothetical protein